MLDYQLRQKDIDCGISRFLMDTYSSSATSKNPKLIIITAGPGAGKTGIEIFYKRRLKELGQRPAIVNSDKVAMYHPYYEQALEELPEDCYKITREFVKPATPVIFDELRKKKISILNERTLKNWRNDLSLIQSFKNDGYEISINIMATDEYIARLSCFEREAKELELGLTPRGISSQTQKIMYNSFVQGVYGIIENGVCDNVNVYIRGNSIAMPERVYTNGDVKYKNFYDALVSEREKQRIYIMEHPGEFLSRIETIKEQIRQNGVLPNLTKNSINGLFELRTQFIKELEKYERKYNKERIDAK